MNFKSTFVVVVSFVALNQSLAAPFYGPALISLESRMHAQMLVENNAVKSDLQKVAEDGKACRGIDEGSKQKIKSGHGIQGFLARMVRYSGPFGCKKF
jgi:hypothetical protein